MFGIFFFFGVAGQIFTCQSVFNVCLIQRIKVIIYVKYIGIQTVLIWIFASKTLCGSLSIQFFFMMMLQE